MDEEYSIIEFLLYIDFKIDLYDIRSNCWYSKKYKVNIFIYHNYLSIYYKKDENIEHIIISNNMLNILKLLLDSLNQNINRIYKINKLLDVNNKNIKGYRTINL